MPRKLADSVVVITGASSGIGRATAHEFARNGATVVLAARREWALNDAAKECEQLGGRALVIPTDVTDEMAVQRLARTAVERFGRVDVWVNNAAVALFAKFGDEPPQIFRQVIETNLFGYVHGARAILPHFKKQGAGVMINVDSVVSNAPQPYTSAYVATKYAIRGMLECMRMELNLDELPNIHLCTVMPSTIDTPLFQQAANYTGREVRAMEPVYPAEKVARTIVDLAQHPRREVVVGNGGRMMMMQHSLMPNRFERTAARKVDQNHLQDRPAGSTQGNLFEPDLDPHNAQVSGGWIKPSQSNAILPAVAIAGLAGLIVGFMLLPPRKPRTSSTAAGSTDGAKTDSTGRGMLREIASTATEWLKEHAGDISTLATGSPLAGRLAKQAL